MIKTKTFAALVGAGVIAFGSAQQASAAFTAGDLILSFQATGGQGATTTFVANLGSSTSYRDAADNSIINNVITIGSDLSTIYGSTWFDRSDLFMNIVAVREGGYSPSTPGVVDGDMRSTIYVSRSKIDANPGSYTAFSMGAASSGSAANNATGYTPTAATALASANSASIPTSTVNTIEDFTTPGGVLQSNFLSFPADFNQSFSSGSLFSYNSATYEGALNLQRLNRSNTTTGAFTGNVVVPGINAGTGSNEGYFGIRDNGQIDYIAVPEPGTIGLAFLGLGLTVLAVRRRKQI